MSGLIRLVYASRANFTPTPSQQGIEPRVARILMQSRKNNPRQKIGGVLYYGNGYFFQCLEGDSEAVNGLTARIMQDDRHSEFQILKASPIGFRLFNNWSMKYVPVDNDVRVFLRDQGLAEFNPFAMNEKQIDALVELFVRYATPDSEKDQDYRDPPVARQGLWQKIKGLFGLG